MRGQEARRPTFLRRWSGGWGTEGQSPHFEATLDGEDSCPKMGQWAGRPDSASAATQTKAVGLVPGVVTAGGWVRGCPPPGRTKQALELGDSTLLQSHLGRREETERPPARGRDEREQEMETWESQRLTKSLSRSSCPHPLWLNAGPFREEIPLVFQPFTSQESPQPPS